MVDAPERIWTDGRQYWTLPPPMTEAEEYLRADIATSQVAEDAGVTREAQYKAEKYDAVVKALSVCDGGRYRNDTIESCILSLAERDRLAAVLRDIAKQWPDSAAAKCARAAIASVKGE